MIPIEERSEKQFKMTRLLAALMLAVMAAAMMMVR